MRFFIGLLTTALTILIAVIGLEITGHYLHSFSLLFIIPAGAGFAGALCSSGYYWAMTKYPIEPKTHQIFVSVLLGVIGFVGIYFTLYQTSYIDDNMELNRKFSGQHISNFIYENTDEPVTFKSFILDEIRSRESTMFIGAGKGKNKVPIPVGSMGFGSIFNLIKFVLEGLGFVVGSWIMSLSMQDEMKLRIPNRPKYMGG